MRVPRAAATGSSSRLTICASCCLESCAQETSRHVDINARCALVLAQPRAILLDETIISASSERTRGSLLLRWLYHQTAGIEFKRKRSLRPKRAISASGR